MNSFNFSPLQAQDKREDPRVGGPFGTAAPACRQPREDQEQARRRNPRNHHRTRECKLQ